MAAGAAGIEFETQRGPFTRVDVTLIEVDEDDSPQVGK